MVVEPRTASADSHLDNLTHALVGAAIAKAGAERATPLALGTLVVSANAPDIDILAFTGGDAFALSFRRGITHGWPALVVLPFFVTGCILAWDRWIRRRRRPELPPARFAAVLVLAAVGMATHPALDWLNTYGMRWGLPFDGSWSYGDALFIIDPWIWLALGGGLALVSSPSRPGWVGWSVLVMATTALMLLGVGGPPAVVWVVSIAVLVAARMRFGPPVEGRRAMRGLCVLVTAYIVAMVVADRRARTLVTTEAQAAGLDVADVLVAPIRGNPLQGHVEVRTAAGYVPGTFRWTARPRVTLRPEALVPFRDVSDLEDAMAQRIIDVATGRPPLSHYLTWARYPYVRVSPVDEGWLVYVGDVRYDDEPAAGELGGMSTLVTPSELP